MVKMLMKSLISKMLSVPIILESGKDGIWNYHKYSDGRYRAWYVGTINLGAGTAWVGGYFHQATSTLTPPSFSTSVASFEGKANSGVLAIYCGYGNGFASYWFNGNAPALNGLAVRLDMYGAWK